MIIRDFKLSDLDRILSIEFEEFNDPYPANMILQLYDLGAGFLVAELNHIVVGYIIFWVKENRIGHIIVIAVDSEYHNMQIGTILIKKSIDIFKRNKINKVILEVRKSNIKARNFYQKNGFVPTDVTPGYYDDGETAIIMQYYNSD